MDATKWKPGGKKHVLQTYANLHKHKLFGEHWLWVAMERVAAGEDEAEVMSDYGYTKTKRWEDHGRCLMAAHRAQLPSEARDLYGGGCGCPQCEEVRALMMGPNA